MRYAVITYTIWLQNLITSDLFQIVGIVLEIWGLYYLTTVIILQRQITLFTTCKFLVLHDMKEYDFLKSQKSWILLKVKKYSWGIKICQQWFVISMQKMNKVDAKQNQAINIYLYLILRWQALARDGASWRALACDGAQNLAKRSFMFGMARGLANSSKSF